MLADIHWPTDEDVLDSVKQRHRMFLIMMVITDVILLKPFVASLSSLLLTYVESVACALTLISISLLTSAWKRSPSAGVGATNLGK